MINFVFMILYFDWLYVHSSYKLFLNPSTTDVVCTTTAEALAMGKIVVCANHPSNEFFKQFPNCRTYDNAKGFLETTRKALRDVPAPLTRHQQYELSWKAATDRFLKASELNTEPLKKQKRSPSSKLYMSASLNIRRNLEDASALIHFLGTGFLNEKPDEQQCKDLKLALPSTRKRATYPRKWGF